MNESQETDFKIGEWWVRPRRNELERGEDAQCVEGRSMAVLVCLARHAPSVVSREKLLEDVWADSPFIGDEVVNHSIWELRKVLGDSAREPTYIKTIPRKGYLLLQEVLRPQGSPLPIEGVRIDHYDIQEELGAGSMGVVYKAVDRRLGRTVAIKFLAPELTRDLKARQRFQREARLAASLDHPNLATVHEVGETTDGHQYMVTAFYSGGSLQDKLACGSFTVEESLNLARQLAAGLGAAHQREIIHRDIKPANLLLDDHGTLKIADFGIAKLQNATQLTRTGASLGTPAYKSPEQAEGLPVDHRTDIWSLGVVLFELLTGHRPFPGHYEQAVVHSILSKEPEPLKDRDGQPLPAEVSRIVSKAMAKDREQRYQSAEELLGDLDGVGVEAPAVFSSKPWHSSSRGIIAAVATLLVLATSLIWLNTRSNLLELPSRPESRSQGDEEGSGASPLGPVGVMTAEQHFVQGNRAWLQGNDVTHADEAEKHFTAALALRPDWEEAQAVLALFRAERYQLRGDPADLEGAERLIDRLFALDATPALAWTARGRLLLVAKKYNDAEQAARKALEIEPICDESGNCDLSYVLLADALWRANPEDLEKAEEALRPCFGKGAGHIRCNLKKAQLYQLSKRGQEAEDLYRKVLEIDRNQVTALSELGSLLSGQRKYEEGSKKLRDAASLSQDPKIHYNLGLVYYLQQSPQRAIEPLKDALEYARKRGEILPAPAVLLGDINFEDQKTKAANRWYEEALHLFEQIVKVEENASPRRLGDRAVCLAKCGRIEDAEKEIQRLLPKADKVPILLLHAARIYALKGDRKTLEHYAEAAISAGFEPMALKNDAAFFRYQEDTEYLDFLDDLADRRLSVAL